MFELVNHGIDTFVGSGPRYHWGGLYGGQIVAQSLRAASSTVDPTYRAHSIRAYFIRPGDHEEPVRYEVDRIRNGRSFATRRIVARQATGAILNAECSFQIPVGGDAVAPVEIPQVAGPDDLVDTSWSGSFRRADIEAIEPAPIGSGRSAAWFRTVAEIGDLDDVERSVLHQCWLAYLSDDMPTEAVRAARAIPPGDAEHFSATSLDHTIWFHRPMRADRWHLHDVSCHHLVAERGLAIGHVFSAHGDHVATYAQEVLLRDRRERPVR